MPVSAAINFYLPVPHSCYQHVW